VNLVAHRHPFPSAASFPSGHAHSGDRAARRPEDPRMRRGGWRLWLESVCLWGGHGAVLSTGLVLRRRLLLSTPRLSGPVGGSQRIRLHTCRRAARRRRWAYPGVRGEVGCCPKGTPPLRSRTIRARHPLAIFRSGFGFDPRQSIENTPVSGTLQRRQGEACRCASSTTVVTAAASRRNRRFLRIPCSFFPSCLPYPSACSLATSSGWVDFPECLRAATFPNRTTLWVTTPTSSSSSSSSSSSKAVSQLVREARRSAVR
jgi:hypothetical protein